MDSLCKKHWIDQEKIESSWRETRQELEFKKKDAFLNVTTVLKVYCTTLPRSLRMAEAQEVGSVFGAMST